MRLAEAGLRVHVVERGPRIGAGQIRRTQDPNYLREHIRSTGGDEISLTHVNAYGGAAPFYEMVSLRSPAAAFRQRSETGTRLWPDGLDRAALDLYYARAEQTMGVRQLESNRIPKTGQVFAQLMQDAGHDCTRLPMAIGNCVGSGFCVTGCVFGAKRGPDMTYLPRAEAAGAEIRTGWVARAIRPLRGAEDAPGGGPIEDVPYRYDVVCVEADADPARYRRVTYRTKLLILASGTVGTAGLLLRNRDTLRHMSRHVGRNVALNVSSKVVALLPSSYPDVDNFSGQSIPGVVSYSLLESHGIVTFPAKPLPVQLLASARLRVEAEEHRGEYWGPDNVAFMKRYRRRALVLVGLAVAPPLAEIRCRPGEGVQPDKLSVRVQSELALEVMQRRCGSCCAVPDASSST